MKRNPDVSISGYRIFVCFFILLLIPVISNGQNLPDLEYPQQGVSFGSPESMVQVRDIQIPMSYNTGTLNVQLPLYEFSYEGYRVPIGLSYNTSGVKVDDEPTVVGLGWRLNAGGSVVRVVRGTYPDGYGCRPCPGLVSPTSAWSRTEFDQRLQDWYDTEPDMYYFSTPTSSGMFVLDRNGSAVQVPYQNLKITAENDDTGGYFIIKDPSGNTYVFGLADNSKDISTQVKSKWNKFKQEYETDSYEYVSAWHLTSISSNGNYIANFFYIESEFPCTTEVVNQSKIYSTVDLNPGGVPDYAGLDRRGEKVYSTTTKVVSRPNYLYFIKWEGGGIRFDVSDNLLREVVIEDARQTYTTSLQLNYGTFYNGYAKLTSIDEYDSANDTKTSVAQFLYNESAALAEDMRFHSDYYGYYNGARAGSTYGIPRIGATYDAVNYVLISKSPDIEYAKANSLCRIVYPLGGYKEFEYELNRSREDLYRREFVASGLRIKKITECAYHGAESAETRYEYGCSVAGSHLDGTGTRTDNVPVHVTSMSIGSERRLYYSVSDKCLTSLTGIDGSVVQYPIVWEILPDGSKNEYTYTTFEDYPDLPASCRSAYDASKPWVDMPQGPVTQTTRHYARGLMTGKASYDNKGKFVAGENHLYELGEVRSSLDVVVPYRGIVEGYSIDPAKIDSEQYVFCKYSWISQPVRHVLEHVISTEYTPGSITEYVYDSTFNLPVEILRTDDCGDRYRTIIKYPFSYPVKSNSTNSMLSSLYNMRRDKPAAPIETVTFKNGSSIEGSVNIYKTQYRLSEQKYLPQRQVAYSDYVFTSVSDSLGFTFDPRYQPDVTYYDYDSANRPLSFRRRNGNIMSVVYDCLGNVIARIDNARHTVDAATNTVFYSSFESERSAPYGDYVGRLAKSGDYVSKSSIYVNLAAIDGEYEVTYWRSSDNGRRWQRVRYRVAGNAGRISISASDRSWIDEVRIIPSDATIETVTYGTNFNRKITETDRNGISVYYEYDGLGRPKETEDNYRNSVESYEIDF